MPAARCRSVLPTCLATWFCTTTYGLHPIHKPDTQAQASVPLMKRTKEGRTPRQKLLLVDDDPNDLVLFAAAIDQVGLDIALQTAVDGRQAIEQIEGRGK